jgi:hypothetical protein
VNSTWTNPRHKSAFSAHTPADQETVHTAAGIRFDYLALPAQILAPLWDHPGTLCVYYRTAPRQLPLFYVPVE